MSGKKPLLKYFSLSLLPIALAVSLGLWLNLTEERYISVWQRGDSVWDLRELDFSGNQVYLLTGSPRIVRGALLEPDELAYHLYRGFYTVSQTWRYTTSLMTVLLPDDDAWYSFSRVSNFVNHRIYVNGEWMMDVGVPGSELETSIPEMSRISFTAQPQNGVIEIVQQSSNFVHSMLGRHNNWYIEIGGRGEAPGRNLVYVNIIISGIFLALALMFIMLFFVLHRQSVTLYFALFCFTWAARVWFMASGDLSPDTGALFGLSWAAEFRIEYLSLPATAALIAAIIGVLFPGILHKFFRYVVYTVSAFFALVFIFAPPYFMREAALDYLMWFFSVCVIYVAVSFARKLRRVNLPQGIFLSGCGVFLYFIMAEFLQRLDMFQMPLFAGWGMSNFIAPIFTLCMGASVFTAARAEMDAAVEARLRLATESRMKDEVMNVIAHETRTPLAVVSGYIELIAKGLRKRGVDEQTANDLDKVTREIQRIARIMAGMQSLEKESVKSYVQLADIIRQAAALYAPMLEGETIDLTVNLPDDPLFVYADAKELTQVLFNLLHNAKNHTAGGAIAITASFDETSVSVEVSDTGAGIAAEILPYVFEHGVSNSERGSGLGLSICRDIINAHGGGIEIESIEGTGTTARFTLPALKEGEVYAENNLIS